MTVLRTPDDRFGNLPDFDFDARYLPVHDPDLGELRMHYVAKANQAPPTVLILHGEPAWSFMFRRTVPVLADAGLRVIVPTLGFGRSDKPSRRTDYSYESHVRWLTEFVAALGWPTRPGGARLGRAARPAAGDWDPWSGQGLCSQQSRLPDRGHAPERRVTPVAGVAASTPEFDVSAIVARACITACQPRCCAATTLPTRRGVQGGRAGVSRTDPGPSGRSVRGGGARVAGRAGRVVHAVPDRLRGAGPDRGRGRRHVSFARARDRGAAARPAGQRRAQHARGRRARCWASGRRFREVGRRADPGRRSSFGRVRTAGDAVAPGLCHALRGGQELTEGPLDVPAFPEQVDGQAQPDGQLEVEAGALVFQAGPSRSRITLIRYFTVDGCRCSSAPASRGTAVGLQIRRGAYR